jgi:hypothetical protein
MTCEVVGGILDLRPIQVNCLAHSCVMNTGLDRDLGGLGTQLLFVSSDGVHRQLHPHTNSKYLCELAGFLSDHANTSSQHTGQVPSRRRCHTQMHKMHT